MRAPDQLASAFTEKNEAVSATEVSTKYVGVEALPVDEVGLTGPALAARVAPIGACHQDQ